MGLGNRVKVLFKSQFNHWVTQAEDPEKIMNQAVQEMEEGLERNRARLSAITHRAIEGGRLLGVIAQEISFWQEKAEEFLKANMEENAKDAVRRRRILEDKERQIKIKIAEDEVKRKEMEALLKELERRVGMAKAKKNILAKELRLRRGVAGRTAEAGEAREVQSEEPFSVFRKMEERVEEESELLHFKQANEKEAWSREEKLIEEEIETLKKNIKKGGINNEIEK